MFELSHFEFLSFVTKGLVTPRDNGFFLVKTMLLKKFLSCFFSPIFIILSEIEEPF